MTELICLDGTFSTQNIVLGKALDGHKAATVTPTSNVINQVPFFGGGGGGWGWGFQVVRHVHNCKVGKNW